MIVLLMQTVICTVLGMSSFSCSLLQLIVFVDVLDDLVQKVWLSPLSRPTVTSKLWPPFNHASRLLFLNFLTTLTLRVTVSIVTLQSVDIPAYQKFNTSDIVMVVFLLHKSFSLPLL